MTEDSQNSTLDDINRNIINTLLYLVPLTDRPYQDAAKALGITPQALKKLLGERRPETSWLVSSGTEEPAGYTDKEKHPELFRTKRIIKSAEVLTRNLDL